MRLTGSRFQDQESRLPRTQLTSRTSGGIGSENCPEDPLPQHYGRGHRTSGTTDAGHIPAKPALSRSGPRCRQYNPDDRIPWSTPVFLHKHPASLFSVSLPGICVAPSSLSQTSFTDGKRPHSTYLTMVMTQLRSPRLAGQLSRHVKASRCFSTSAALRKEIQDAYILSASRTPTAKVRIPPHSMSL